MSIFGETLRQARAHKGVTVKEAEQATRISRLYLSALEDEHFEALPPLIYQRGIVRNYATYLDLDPNKLLAMFEDARGGVVEPEVAPSVAPLNMPSHWAPNFAIIAFVLVLGMIVFAWFYSAFLAPGDPVATATAPVETVTPLPTEAEGRSRLVSLVPTPTKSATAEPSSGTELTADVEQATATPEPTEEPSPTPTTGVEVAGTGSNDDATVVQEVAPEVPAEQEAVDAPPVVEEQPTQSGPTVRVLFSPTADIVLTVYADGELIWEGPVPAGGTAGPFEAHYFDVWTSDLNDTWITNLDTGQTFYMSDADGEGTFPLAPM